MLFVDRLWCGESWIVKIAEYEQHHDGTSYIRSTNFAKVFERRHDNVADKIEKTLLKMPCFKERSYTTSQGNSYSEYLITESGFLELTKKYKTEAQLNLS